MPPKYCDSHERDDSMLETASTNITVDRCSLGFHVLCSIRGF